MDIKKIISKMTLEEKVALCSGSDFWHTKSIERLGVPNIMFSDGPYGLRKQDLKNDNLGINNSIKAVCFPASCATAASFNRSLIYRLGEGLGIACQSENVATILGPAVNIKRSPLCGRNFEYFSEDPFLTSEMATNYIKGVQSKNIGTSIKHFLANNQEHRRMTSSSNIDERTLREIYLTAFESPIIDGKPWSVMCSYNRVNGVQVSESYRFLTTVLRNEWGFDGYVLSDWGAVKDRILGLKAGLDLEMPSSNGMNDKDIIEAVGDGSLDEKILNKSVERILNSVFKYEKNKNVNVEWNKEEQHKLAREIEDECIVLLKNEDILPLDGKSSTAFIGLFAKEPRYQGGGSSHINSFKIESALEAVKSKQNVLYAQGYNVDSEIINRNLINEAVSIAKNVKTAIVFVGLPDSFESEGYDRKHMKLPVNQTELIKAIIEVQPNTVIVLHNGSPIEMPWINEVKGVIELYLGGQAVGASTVDILYGDVNPSGRLPETFPIKLEDNPSYLFYGGEKDNVEYREGIFVGYRYYDKKNIDVLYPFGYGLSYTKFKYSNMKLDKKRMRDTDILTVSVDITNVGDVFGKEVVQVYVEDVDGDIIRPIRELKGFEKVPLYPGETKTVSFKLSKRSFAYFNTEINDWHVESGEFIISIGKSSREIICNSKIFVESTVKIPIIYNDNTTIGDLLNNTETMMVLKPLLDKFGEKSLFTQVSSESSLEAISLEMLEAMIKYMPLRQLLSFGNIINRQELNRIIDELNKLKK